MSKLQVSQQRQNLLKQLSSLQEQKDYAAALAVAAEYNQLTEQTCGSESVEAAESLFTFARACLDVGKPAMAEQPLQRSLALCRRHFGEQLRAGNLNNFATSMLDLGKTAEADQLWQEALQAEPHHPEATYNRGLLAWRSGAITDETLLQQLAEVQASHGRERVAVLTALVHLERGSCGEALAALPDPSVDRPEPSDLAAVRAMIQRHTANAPGLLRSWLANDRMVYGLALSPDGRQALSAGMDGTIKLWDTETATCLRTIAAHAQRGLVALAARSDWTQACSAGGDGHLKVWDVATGECLRDLGEDANPFGVTLSAPGDGSRALVGGWMDKIAELWDVAGSRLVRRFAGHEYPIIGVALSADGKTALTRDCTTLKQWDTASGQCLLTWNVDMHPGPRIPLLSDDAVSLIVTLKENCDIIAVDMATGRVIQQLAGHTDAVCDVAWCFGPPRLASAGADKTVRLWDFHQGRCIRTFEGHASPVLSVATSRDGRRVASCDQEGNLFLWNSEPWEVQAPFQLSQVRRNEEVSDAMQVFRRNLELARQALGQEDYPAAESALRAARQDADYQRHPAATRLWGGLYRRLPRRSLQGSWAHRVLEGHTTFVQSVAVSEDGRRLLSLSREGTLKLWDTEAGRCTWSEQCPVEGEPTKDSPNPAIFWCADLSPDGRQGVVTCFDSTVKVWDLQEGRHLRSLRGHGTKVLATRFTLDGSRALSTAADRAVKLWDVGTGQCVRTFPEAHKSTVTAVCPGRDGRTAFTGGMDTTVRLWDLTTGRCESEYRLPEMEHVLLTAIDTSPDGRLLLAAAGERMYLWEVASGRRLLALAGHVPMALASRFSPDGRFVLSGGRDRALKLWEVASGQCVRTFGGHPDDVLSVAFSPDGQFAYSGSFGAVTQYWLDWELDPRPLAEWDEAARPYLELFLRGHAPTTPAPSLWTRLFGKADDRPRIPTWDERDVTALLRMLEAAGFGWLRPDGVRRELDRLAGR